MPTWMAAVISSVLQRNEVPPLAVNVVVLPGQNANVPVMTAVGSAFTTTVTEASSVQPFASVAVTVYVPAEATLIELVVALVLHL